MSNKKITLEEAIKVIPKGFYCYGHTEAIPGHPKHARRIIGLCPYWSRRKGKPSQMDGYWDFLKQGDWQEKGTMLLWDQCKECGINEPTAEELEAEANDPRR